MSMLKKILLLVPVILAVMLPAVAQTAPNAPQGLTAISQDGKVVLAWQASSGATGYKVYRGTSAASITQLLASPTSATYTDTTATNATTYFYAVKASGGGDSAASATAQATPRARSCSTGSTIAVENCFPGTAAWKLQSPGTAYAGGIEGFASATSVNAGGSVDLKVNTGANATYHVEIYRMGWYGGQHGRLVSVLPGLSGVHQDPCQDGAGDTGLLDCSNWQTTSTITTTTDWPSGIYWLRLVRDSTGDDAAVLLTVRNDGSHSDILYTLPISTYEAYNNYGGKSLYDFNSGGNLTVSGTARAVKVSYDRPFAEPYTGDQNWFGVADVQNVAFLEREGYDVNYITSVDLHASGGQLTNHKVYLSPAHDEYWSAEMRSAVTAARNAGTNVFWLGSNQVYWKIRYEASPFSGTQNRVEVGYKTTQSGAVDPVSPTGTWRDPAGANQPENALAGQMYIGDNDQSSFPLVVSAAQGANRIWRHTELAGLASGTTATIGTKLVGWEWNDRIANGSEPSGLQTFAASPVNGALVQGNGASYTNGSATQTSTTYRAASGAWVVSTGTNNWSRGLDLDQFDTGEPNIDIQQATVNVLTDMNTRPTTPTSGITVDPAGGPVVSSTSPTAGATGVVTSNSVKATFDRSVDPASVTTQTFTVTPQGGSAVAASVSYDDATRTATLNPSAQLSAFTTYTARLVGGPSGISGWGGNLAADVTWTFSTGSGTPPVVSSTTPVSGATDVAPSSTVTATFDRAIDPTTLTTTNFNVKTSSGGVAAAGSVAYNSATRTATFTPSAGLTPSTQYTATVTTAVKATDGTALAAAVSWQFTIAAVPQITTRTPAPLATGVSPYTAVSVGFSRPMDSTTFTAAAFSLKTSGGVAVAATIAYDATSQTATLTPNASLLLGSTYTVALTTAIKDTSGTPLASSSSWTFTVTPTAPTAPSVTAVQPVDGAVGIAGDTVVTATFDRALDPATVSGQTFTLVDSTNTAIAATVTFNSGTSTATLTPTGTLSPNKTYTAKLGTGVRGADGTPLQAAVSWTFTTGTCPCSLLGTSQPTLTNLDVVDGRGGAGPFTYELGTQFTVDQAMQLSSIRFYKDAGETGTHVGTLWTSAGVQVAQTSFQNESASGWQKQTLSAPATLQPGLTYVVSVGLNTRFVMTPGGLSAQINNGPLHSIVGPNGVFGNSAGTFPTQTYGGGNYFVDPVVSLPAPSGAPQVTARLPVDTATGVDPATKVTATFSTDLDPTSVSGSTFTLKNGVGTSVAATVSYDAATKTAKLTPTAALALGTTYTATLTTGIKASDGTPMAAAVTWTFATTTSAAPTVTSTSPATGTTLVSPATAVQATFSASMAPATLTSQTFTLTGPGGAAVSANVSYNDTTRTATLQPSTTLAASTVYTATVTTGAKSAAGTPLGAAKTWTFTTSACPCTLLAASSTPASTGNPTQDGRGGAGPFTLELGVKLKVTQAASITAVRFYKDAGETGSHVGRIWSSTGTLLASVTFAGETASGWQQQSLASPLTLTAGTTYVVSVGYNAKFDLTGAGFASQITSGPLQSIVGSNGVYALTAGTFPNQSWNASNYFVDAVVR